MAGSRYRLVAGATGSRQRKFRIEKVAAPRVRYWKKQSEFFAPAYLNAYVANGAVICARFGDPKRDQAARAALEKAFPNRVVVQIEINHIAEGGGGIHCLTQPMPLIEVPCRGVLAGSEEKLPLFATYNLKRPRVSNRELEQRIIRRRRSIIEHRQ